MALLIDVHSHLDHKMFEDDLPEVLVRAKEAGLKVVIANGVDPQTNRAVVEIARKHSIVKPALGIYPPDALQEETKEGAYPLTIKPYDLDEELKFIEQADPIAFGEIGLDYKNCKNEELQKDIFQKFISLAEKTGKPMIIHSRKAEQAVIEMLESSDVKKVVLHCFSGRFSLVKRARDNGWSFSIPTSVVKSEHFQKMVREIDISRIFAETDCPYMSPFVGKRNEPAYVVESYKKIAELKGMTLEDTASNIFMNYQNMFL